MKTIKDAVIQFKAQWPEGATHLLTTGREYSGLFTGAIVAANLTGDVFYAAKSPQKYL